MYNKNVPAVPSYDADKIIKKIESKVQQLEDTEKIVIADLINYHSCEASVIAERVSKYLDVDYNAIMDLL